MQTLQAAGVAPAALSRALWGGLIATVMLLSGCAEEPAGPPGRSIKAPPGFIFDARAEKYRNVFPDAEIVEQTSWFSLKDEGGSSIFVTQYEGPTDWGEIEEARDTLGSRYAYLEYGEVEDLEIDGLPAWGWLETQYMEDAVRALEYRAVVSGDTVTYAIEFFTSSPEWMDEDLMRDMVSTFRTPREAQAIPSVAVAGAILLGIFIVYRTVGRS